MCPSDCEGVCSAASSEFSIRDVCDSNVSSFNSSNAKMYGIGVYQISNILEMGVLVVPKGSDLSEGDLNRYSYLLCVFSLVMTLILLMMLFLVTTKRIL